VIIPAPPGVTLAFAFTDPDVEILVARGSAPSAQRNAAIREASGDLIYFLDDDSVPDPGTLDLITEVMSRDERIVGVGGPSLPPENAGPWQRLMGALFAHPLGTFGYRLRYTTAGPGGPTGDEGLILANLCIRRSALLAAGGFDERLYPNEENHLIDRLRAEGGIFIRDARLIVRRPHRGSLLSLAKQMWRYGRGRAAQTRLLPTASSITRALLAVGLAVVPPLATTVVALVGGLAPLVFAGPGYYAVLVAGAAITSIRHHSPALLALAPLFLICHAVYGLGVASGFLVPQRHVASLESVRVERVSLGDDPVAVQGGA
jgi:succinoglycan biosynthesis protein ExoA